MSYFKNPEKPAQSSSTTALLSDKAVGNLNKPALRNSGRAHVEFIPNVGTSLATNASRITKIQVAFDPADYAFQNPVYHGHESYIAFDVSATNSGNNPALLSDIWSIWKTYKVRLNGKEIEKRDEVGHQQVLERRAILSNSYRNSIGKITALIDDTESNNQNLGTVRCALPFPCNSFMSQTIPINKKFCIEVELELNSDADAISTADTGTTVVAVSDIKVHCDVVSHSVKDSLWNGIVRYEECEVQQFTIADGATSANLQIPVSTDDLKAVQAVMLDSDTYQAQGTYTKMTHTLFNGTTTYQYKLGGKLYPPNPVDCSNGVMPLLQHLRVFNVLIDPLRDANAPGALDGSYDNNTLSTGFSMCYDFRSDVNYVSSANNIAGRQLVLEWRGTANQPTTVLAFMFYDRAVQM